MLKAKRSALVERGLAEGRDWSKEWNAMPYETRLICAKVESQMRINQLVMERDRVKRYYKRHIADINSHIANLKRALEMD